MKPGSYICIGLLFGLVLSGSGKDKNQPSYPIETISPGLKKDASAICRDYRHEFELSYYGKAIEKVHLVMTVLDENGDHFGLLQVPYDQSRKVKPISGKSYNQAGLPDDKLGLGGYKLFSAVTVDLLGSGDCKALSKEGNWSGLPCLSQSKIPGSERPGAITARRLPFKTTGLFLSAN